MLKKYSYYLLIIIVLMGAALRIFRLGTIPPSLNWDEVSHGYNAFSILNTGSDEWGAKLPLINFRAYGDYPLPLNLYLTIPSIMFFGLNEVGIRFPHVVFGIITIIASFFLGLGATKNKKIALITAFLVSVEPWTLFPSRFVAQSNVAVMLLTVATASFFYIRKSKFYLILSIASFGLSIYAYHTTRILSPLILIAFLYVYRAELFRNLKINTITVLSAILLSLTFFPLLFIYLSPDARARSEFVFSLDGGAVNNINNLRGKYDFNPIVERLAFNKVTYFSVLFTKKYFDYFSPGYLFFNGGTQYQFSVPNHGVLYLVNLPFFYIGLVLLLKRFNKNQENKVLLAWLLLAPIPAAITNENFAVLRSSGLLPLPQLLSGLGLVGLLEYLNTKLKISSLLVKIFTFAYFLLVLVFLIRYLVAYLGTYSEKYSWAWQYGYKEMSLFVQANYDKYDKIIITKKYGEPHEFLLFHLKYDPNKFKSDKNLVRFYQSKWYWIDSFDKFYFVNDWQVDTYKNKFILESKSEVDCEKLNCLLITSPSNYPKGWTKVKTMHFLDGAPNFELYEN